MAYAELKRVRADYLTKKPTNDYEDYPPAKRDFWGDWAEFKQGVKGMGLKTAIWEGYMPRFYDYIYPFESLESLTHWGFFHDYDSPNLIGKPPKIFTDYKEAIGYGLVIETIWHASQFKGWSGSDLKNRELNGKEQEMFDKSLPLWLENYKPQPDTPPNPAEFDIVKKAGELYYDYYSLDEGHTPPNDKQLKDFYNLLRGVI